MSVLTTYTFMGSHQVLVLETYTDDLLKRDFCVVRYLEGPKQGQRRTVCASSVTVLAV